MCFSLIRTKTARKAVPQKYVTAWLPMTLNVYLTTIAATQSTYLRSFQYKTTRNFPYTNVASIRITRIQHDICSFPTEWEKQLLSFLPILVKRSIVPHGAMCMRHFRRITSISLRSLKRPGSAFVVQTSLYILEILRAWSRNEEANRMHQLVNVTWKCSINSSSSSFTRWRSKREDDAELPGLAFCNSFAMKRVPGVQQNTPFQRPLDVKCWKRNTILLCASSVHLHNVLTWE